MADSEISAELQQLTQGLRYTFNGNYSQAAALTLLVYNIFSTFEEEVRHIWSGGWSFSKFLYVFVRYYGLIFMGSTLAVNTKENVSIKVCQAYLWYWEMSGAFVFLTCVNVICALRIYALYARDKRLLGLLIFLCSGEFASEFYGTFGIVRHTSTSVVRAPLGIPFPGCLTVDRYTKIGLAAWIPSVTMAFVFFLFTVAKLRHILEDKEGRWRISRLKETSLISPLLLSFGQGGIIYFFLIFSALLVSAILSIVQAGVHFPLIYPWLITVYALAGSNLILSLRAATERDDLGGSDPMPLNSIRFKTVNSAQHGGPTESAIDA